MMATVNIGSLPFKEQIDYFRKKASVGTRAWTDLWQEQHDHSFVVAGAMKGDLLADLRTAVDGVIADGTTLEQFRQGFDEIVAKHGWEYKGGRNWRTRVIYDTNLRSSYQAGRYAQLKDPDLLQLRPYWMYKHSDLVVDPRPEHLAWDGLVLSHDDPWWDTHYPPNGWGCMCSVRPVGERQLKQMGKDGPDTAPPIEYETKTVGARGPSPRTVQVPKGIDPGWAYAPGRDSWMQSFTPAQLDDLLPASGALAADALPAARVAPISRVLPDRLTEREYIDRFLHEFGVDTAAAERATIFKDVMDEHLVISDQLFIDRAGNYKVMKRDRATFVLLMADTIKHPDEIWLDWVSYRNKTSLRRRYVAQWSVQGQTVPALAVFETGPAGWAGVTAMTADDIKYLNTRVRRGTRVWVRK